MFQQLIGNIENLNLEVEGLDLSVLTQNKNLEDLENSDNYLIFARLGESPEAIDSDMFLPILSINENFNIYTSFTYDLQQGKKYYITGTFTNPDESTKIYISKVTESGSITDVDNILETFEPGANGTDSYNFEYQGFLNNPLQEDMQIKIWARRIFSILNPQELSVVCSEYANNEVLVYKLTDSFTEWSYTPPNQSSTSSEWEFELTYAITPNFEYSDTSVKIIMTDWPFEEDYQPQFQPIDISNNEWLSEEQQAKILSNVKNGIYCLENKLDFGSIENQNLFITSINNVNPDAVGVSGSFIKNVNYDSAVSIPNYQDCDMYGKRLLVWTTLPEENSSNSFNIEVEQKVSHGCLTGDTMITLANGQTKRLDQLEVGEEVLDKDQKPNKILQVKKNIVLPERTEYYFSNNTKVSEVGEHRFYNKTQGFWQRLKRWNIGDIAIDEFGNEVALVKRETIKEPTELYGIITETGSYYANGLLSGMAKLNRDLLSESSVEQAIEMMASVGEKELANLLGVKEGLI